MAYHLRQQGSTVKLLRETFEEGATRIVLYEDSLLSGSQACAVLLSWFGQLPSHSDDEAKPLSDEMQRWIRSIEISFAFTVGAPEGLEALEKCAKALSLKLRKGDDGSPVILLALGRFQTLADVQLQDRERSKLVDFLGEVGEELLSSTKGKSKPDKWTPELCRKRAMGYSGDGGLAVFGGNSPTSTITALWCTAGLFRGVPWMPLFPRIDPDEFGPPAPTKK